MTWRRLAGLVAFLWLGALSGFFYKYRDDLLLIGKALTTERWQRERLDRELQAFGQTQRQHASNLISLQTAVAANTEICGAHPPDLTERLAVSEATLARAEAARTEADRRLAELEARAAANARAQQELRRRIFRD